MLPCQYMKYQLTYIQPTNGTFSTINEKMGCNTINKHIMPWRSQVIEPIKHSTNLTFVSSTLPSHNFNLHDQILRVTMPPFFMVIVKTYVSHHYPIFCCNISENKHKDFKTHQCTSRNLRIKCSTYNFMITTKVILRATFIEIKLLKLVTSIVKSILHRIWWM